MTNMFMVVLFLCQLLSIYGQPTPSVSTLYNFTSVDKCNTTLPQVSKFRTELGLDFTTQVMIEASDMILKVLEQPNVNDRKIAAGAKFRLDVHDFFKEDNGHYFYNPADDTHTIEMNAELVLENIPGFSVKDRFKEVVYHEMTHAWQWFATDGPTPQPLMLIEGIAEYVPLVAGLKNYGDKKPGRGDKWDQGYDFTAFFLEYCNSLKPGVVAELNKRMKSTYSDAYFMELLGKPVEELWKDYKNKYPNVV